MGRRKCMHKWKQCRGLIFFFFTWSFNFYQTYVRCKSPLRQDRDNEILRLQFSFRNRQPNHVPHICLLDKGTHMMEDLCWMSVGHQCCFVVCSGAVGLVWFVLWAFFVFDSPNTHPRISEQERLYITSSLKNEVTVVT